MAARRRRLEAVVATGRAPESRSERSLIAGEYPGFVGWPKTEHPKKLGRPARISRTTLVPLSERRAIVRPLFPLPKAPRAEPLLPLWVGLGETSGSQSKKDMKQLEVLRAELERLFELDELLTLSRDVLGFDPDVVGGKTSLGSFAGALLSHCQAEDAVEALCDALRSTGKDLNPIVAQIAAGERVEDPALSAGDELGPYHIARKLGDGRLGATYLAKSEGRDVRLKVLHPEAVKNRSGLHRFLTLTRLAGRVTHPAFPELLYAGPLADRYAVAQSYVEGQPLSVRVARTGPMHINEARPILLSLVAAVQALHEKQLTHGSLSLENVITYRGADGEPALALLDIGSGRLRVRQSKNRTGLASTGANPRTAAPEQIRGADADKQSDLYSLGALMFELLSGKPPFEGDVLEVAFAHLMTPAPVVSSIAPRGWATQDIDTIVARLLAKRPQQRGSIQELLHALENLGRSQENLVSEEQIETMEKQLLANPENGELALQLESATSQGAQPERIGQAFRLAASMIDDPAQGDVKASLLRRAARLLEQAPEALERAEAVYEDLLAIMPRDSVALAGLEQVRRRLGKFEELVEMLLARAEAAPSADERARAMAEIGRIYLRDLQDPEQAVVAYSQAFTDDPCDEYAEGVERAAGHTESLWAEALSAVHDATQNPEATPETRSQLLLQAGTWYRTKLSRPDLALPCFQQVLSIEPSNEKALTGLTAIYKKAQQWQELGRILTHRADAAATPSLARDLRAESGEVLEQNLGDLQGARAVYEQVLTEDPSHATAGAGLSRVLESLGDFDGLVAHLDRQVAAQTGADAVRTLCRAGELYEERLENPAKAVDSYLKALEIDPESMDALRGLERVYTKNGKYRELVDILERQVGLAATPKQRIALLEKIASVHEEEFLDHHAAASALWRALEADSGRVSAMATLIRHLRVLERWEQASQLYERQMALVEDPAERCSLGTAWGRLLTEQIGSPERAMQAYELVLETDPEHAGALEALARLRESTGDASRALEAILTLAEKAETPESRAEHYRHAAALLEGRGDLDTAIEHYKNALDAAPEDRNLSAALRAAYVKRGEVNAAVEMLEREIEIVEGDRAQAKLAGEMARLQREGLRDDTRAESSAGRALRLDPSNIDALLVLGDICFEQGRYVEAGSYYARIGERVETLGNDTAIKVLQRYVDALSKSGSTEDAVAAVDTLMRLAPDDRDAMERVTQVVFEHGTPKRAVELLSNYLRRFDAELGEMEKAMAMYRLGEAMRKGGNPRGAVSRLQEASDLDPGLAEPLRALGTAYEELKNYKEAVKAKTKLLELALGDERAELLIEIGDLYAGKLKDHTSAANFYVAALEDRPEDRRLLTKLMQLYSEDKDWNKLIDIVVKLAEFVDEPSQKVKYLHTAALVSSRQLRDTAAAADFLEQVLELDPANHKALQELIKIQKAANNYPAVEELLKRAISHAEQKGDVPARIATYEQLSELYQKHLHDPEKAAEALEAANELDPGNRERLDKLAVIYSSDVARFKDKGILLQEALLAQTPYRQESYKALRKIYTVARDADASWALCQVLSVLKLAEPDEERFYQRMRSETAAPAQEAFSEDDWYSRIIHPSVDPLLTAIFATIEPAVIKARAQPYEQLGVSGDMFVDPSQHESPLAQTLYYAAGVLGVELPNVFANPSDQGGLSYLYTEAPSLQMGRMAMSRQVPPQVAAFVAARQLAYNRSGFYLRHFVQTGTAMKAWLFAAIKATSPQFPVAADLEGPVNENVTALKQHLAGDAKDHLASLVSKLLQAGTSLDLKRWVGAVDLTADRAGFVVAHDLATVVEVIQASEEGTAGVSNADRLKEIVLFASSAKYFEMRRRLGITVEN